MYTIDTFILNRLKLISERTTVLNQNPKSINKQEREEIAMMLAITFKDFKDFAFIGMKYLGFTLTDMQADIAEYISNGVKKKMVGAQRGEAKSTLAALYSVWKLIQDQRTRVLIVSAADKQASEIATLIIRLIDNWHLLCVYKADPSRGDRASYEAYDIHCDLKPLDKSPSVACIGVTASLQGKRADVLIADDIESSKNGLTQRERSKLIEISKDFSAICTHGEILYLGTYQTKNSIYKTLPSRGFEVRLWTGRIPNNASIEKYGAALAPYILELVEAGAAQTGYGIDGTRGESADPERYSEDILIEKELDFGPEGFELQYMLNAELSDELRTRIKLSDLIVLNGDYNSAPDRILWLGDERYRIPNVDSVPDAKIYSAASTGTELLPYDHKLMVVDPAGCGGDEVSFVAGAACSSYIHVFKVGGLVGGISNENIDTIINDAVDMGINDIVIESNMGHGTVRMLFMNRLNERKITGIGVRDLFNTAQKERRIIDTISPISRRHRLVIHNTAIENDIKCCMQYNRDKRWMYSLLNQLHHITYDRGCLAKDDRADALCMLVQELNAHLVKDEKQAIEAVKQKEMQEFLENPMQYDMSKKVSHRWV